MEDNPRLKQVVMIGETSVCESVPQANGSREKAVRVEFNSHQLNREEMRLVCYNVNSMASNFHVNSDRTLSFATSSL